MKKQNKKYLFILMTFLSSVIAFSEISYPSYNNAEKLVLTEDEKIFLNEHPIMKVAAETNWPPLEYYNNLSDVLQFTGINVSILKEIGKILGIDFIFVTTKNNSESVQMLNANQIDIVTYFSGRSNNKISFSDKLYEIPFVLVSTHKKILISGNKIAIPYMLESEIQNLTRIFPYDNYKFVYYNKSQDIIEALKSGKIDFGIINEFEYNDINDFNFTMKSLPIKISERFAFSENINETGVALFNKAYEYISQTRFETLVYSTQIERWYYKQEIKNTKKINRAVILYFVIFSFLLIIITILIIKYIFTRNFNILNQDSITGTPTFSKFKKDIKNILKGATPNEYMLLSIDINNFRYINESYNYEFGNAILNEFSGHLITISSEYHFLLCRFYADNFILFGKNPGYFNKIIEIINNLTDLNISIKKLLPENYKLDCSSSVFYINNPRESITAMIDKANIARKIGKSSQSTNNIVEYTNEMDLANEMKKTITFSMNKAFEDKEFIVYYQPKYRFSNSEIIGAEALIRWKNPMKGLLPPSQFVPLFEQNGFIQKIDFFVFENVCKLIDKWNKASKNKMCPKPITISFNLSRAHLYNQNLITELKNIMKNYQIEPCKIEVELTESIVFDNKKRLIRVMQDLKESGYDISVDDFGSGYSSLNLLKDMPADIIKLDKDFLSGANVNEKEGIIISSVIEMAKKLALRTIAEGVETEVQRDFLQKSGCDFVQGFLYSKPLPENDFFMLLTKSYNN